MSTFDLVFRFVVLPSGLLVASVCLAVQIREFFDDLRRPSGGEWMGPVLHAQAARLPHPPTDGGLYDAESTRLPNGGRA